MPYYTYIIQSERTGSLYIGQTSDIDNRLYRHNTNQSLSTKNKGPWKLIFRKVFENRFEAVKLEIKLKSFKNKTRILRWIDIHSGQSVPDNSCLEGRHASAGSPRQLMPYYTLHNTIRKHGLLIYRNSSIFLKLFKQQ